MNVISSDHFNERTLPVLTPPDLSHEAIAATLRDHYGLPIRAATFLPLGADVNAAVFRVEAEDGTPYFLKLKRGDFDSIGVAIPAFLHGEGITEVMAPLPTTAGQYWASANEYTWILYPFFAGEDGFHRPLTPSHWVTLGRTLHAVHETALPPALRARVPIEDYSPRWREVVRILDRQVETTEYADPLAARLATFWREEARPDIRAMVERAEALGEQLRERSGALVLCHTDLHAWNVLLSTANDHELVIVDWDAPLLAPRERDLMFIGAGIGAIWDTEEEATLFYRGYDAVEVDLVALSYYRYERFVEDVAAYGEQILGGQGSADDRLHGLEGLMSGFRPHREVAIAHQTYARLPSR